MQPIVWMAEGDLSCHDMGSRHRAATACAMTDAADDVGLGDDAGHLAAIVTDDDQVLSWAIQQFCGINQQSICSDRYQFFLNRW